jgi:hypothetical protein
MRSIYGYAAEFEDPTKLLEAARRAREVGYRQIEAYSPYFIRELDEIIPMRNPLPLIVFLAGITGTVTAWALQTGIAVWDYPINVGGRPLYSWPAFVPIMFELTVLFAGGAAFFGTWWLCGLPCVHHPVFNVGQFARVTDDRFFLCIESRDTKFYPEDTYEFLANLKPLHVWEIEDE